MEDFLAWDEQIESAVLALGCGEGVLALKLECVSLISLSAQLSPALRATSRPLDSLCIWNNLDRANGLAAFKSLLKAMTDNRECCCYQMETLSLQRLRFGIEGAICLSAVLRQFSNLKSLDLFGNRLYDEGCSILCESMASLSHLEILSLIENRIDNEGAQSLIRVLPRLNNLKHLFLGGNIFDKAANVSLLLCASEHSSQLQNLKLGFRIDDLVGLPAIDMNMATYFPFVRSHPLHILSGAGDEKQVRKLLQSKAYDANTKEEVIFWEKHPCFFFSLKKFF